LPAYPYGGLGLRGRGEWFRRSATRPSCSRNETDRIKRQSNRARLVLTSVAMSMVGRLAPACFGKFPRPQPLRIHPIERTFGFPFIFATRRLAIEPGKPYVAAIAFIVADGPAQSSVAQRLFGTPTRKPASVKVEAQ